MRAHHLDLEQVFLYQRKLKRLIEEGLEFGLELYLGEMRGGFCA
jgi:hypothetical protein